MRLLVHEERYTPEGDCEGLTHAEMINQHLPPQIRVFAVQKTNKVGRETYMLSTRAYHNKTSSSLTPKLYVYRNSMHVTLARQESMSTTFQCHSWVSGVVNEYVIICAFV